MGYLSLKWLHIIAVISWMCGILYLFRLFVYHCERGRGDSAAIHDLLCTMERRLYKAITVPAMLVAWGAGLGIIYTMPLYASEAWFHTKLFFVLTLTFVTTRAGKMVRNFAEISNPVPTSRKLRWLNELPTLLMMVIVGLVVFKPWR